jgi:TfoX/Sxy family transcriptional regulator of competence genes
MVKRVAAKKKMPAFTKPTEPTVRAFDEAIDGLSGVQRRAMFGYPAAFVNGNMLASIFQDRIMIRLGDAERALALAIEGARPFEPMPGRAMKEYVDLPTSVTRDAAALGQWLQRARDYAASLPPKKSKKKS